MKHVKGKLIAESLIGIFMANEHPDHLIKEMSYDVAFKYFPEDKYWIVHVFMKHPESEYYEWASIIVKWDDEFYMFEEIERKGAVSRSVLTDTSVCDFDEASEEDIADIAEAVTPDDCLWKVYLEEVNL